MFIIVLNVEHVLNTSLSTRSFVGYKTCFLHTPKLGLAVFYALLLHIHVPLTILNCVSTNIPAC